MKTSRNLRLLGRRSFIKTIVITGCAPLVVPSHVVGANGQTPPSSRISVGVIGTGAQGTSDMHGFLKEKDAKVVAICDVNKRNLSNARNIIAKTYGQDDVKEYADFRELNANKSIDAVLMALPVHWHSIPALDSILNGKHIYHEKPMAMSFEEAKRVRAAVNKKKVVFQFGTQQRSDPKFRWACELALSGRLGKLKEIHVSVPAGKGGPAFPEQTVPDYLDWNRWVGPAPWSPFHQEKLNRDCHEHITNFSLGMISCWGIHHMDIAQWGNNTDDTGPKTIEGEGAFPKEGSLDTILTWKVRFEYDKATPIVFVNDGTPGFEHGVRFVGESTWLHVRRGDIKSEKEEFLRDPQSQPQALPVHLPVSHDHTRNFLDAIKQGKRAICDINTAVRGDTLCQLALIAVKRGKKLEWNPAKEKITNDSIANAMLQPRPFRETWKLPKV